MTNMMDKSYSEMARLESFEDRFNYLQLNGFVGRSTFGFDRYLNQQFYRSAQWKRVRQQVIARDLGLDLGVEGYGIFDKVLVHHMNPIVSEDIIHFDPQILNPEFLISVSHDTHNAIHYGDSKLLRQPSVVERRPGDTTPW